MKIASKTDQRLVLRHVPWLLAGSLALIGGVTLWFVFTDPTLADEAPVWIAHLFGFGALAIAWWAAPVMTLDLDRARNLVTFTEARLLHTRRRYAPLDKVARARQQAEWSDDSRLTRLALEIDGKVAPVEIGFGASDRNAIEAEINRWLEGGDADRAR